MSTIEQSLPPSFQLEPDSPQKVPIPESELPQKVPIPLPPVPAPTPVPEPVPESDPVADTPVPIPLPPPVSALPISLIGSTGGGTFAQPGSEGAIPFRTPNFGVNRYVGPELIRGPGVPIHGRGWGRGLRPWEDLPGKGKGRRV